MKRYYQCWKPKQEKKEKSFILDDLIIAFFLGFTVCLYLKMLY